MRLDFRSFASGRAFSFELLNLSVVAFSAFRGNAPDVEMLRQMANQQKRFTVMIFAEEGETE